MTGIKIYLSLVVCMVLPPAPPPADPLSMDRTDDAPVDLQSPDRQTSQLAVRGGRKGLSWDFFTFGHGALCLVSVRRQSLQAANPSSIDSDAVPSSSPSAPCYFRTPHLSPRGHLSDCWTVFICRMGLSGVGLL